MPYTPPVGSSVGFNFSGAYTPPGGTAADFNFGAGGGGGGGGGSAAGTAPTGLRLLLTEQDEWRWTRRQAFAPVTGTPANIVPYRRRQFMLADTDEQLWTPPHRAIRFVPIVPGRRRVLFCVT
jgi:hypothetical protein